MSGPVTVDGPEVRIVGKTQLPTFVNHTPERWQWLGRNDINVVSPDIAGERGWVLRVGGAGRGEGGVIEGYLPSALRTSLYLSI